MEETFGAFLFTSEQSCRFILKFKADDDSYSFYLYKKKKINFPYGGDLHKNYQTSQKILFFFAEEKITSESRKFSAGAQHNERSFLIYLHKKSATRITYYSTLSIHSKHTVMVVVVE